MQIVWKFFVFISLFIAMKWSNCHSISTNSNEQIEQFRMHLIVGILTLETRYSTIGVKQNPWKSLIATILMQWEIVFVRHSQQLIKMILIFSSNLLRFYECNIKALRIPVQPIFSSLSFCQNWIYVEKRQTIQHCNAHDKSILMCCAFFRPRTNQINSIKSSSRQT